MARLTAPARTHGDVRVIGTSDKRGAAAHRVRQRGEATSATPTAREWLPRRVPYALLGIMAGLATWETVVRLADVPAYVLPSLADVLATAIGERGYLLDETWITFQEAALGFLIGVGTGCVLAVLIVTWKLVASALYPLIVVSQVVPKIAIAPIFLVLFGFGLTSKVVIAALLSFFPVVMAAVFGLRSARVETIHLARSMGAGYWRTFMRIRVPAALPEVFAGLKLAGVFAVTGAIVGEFVGSDRGLGRVVIAASSTLETEIVFAGVLYIACIGFAFFLALQYLEAAVVHWHPSQRRRRYKRHAYRR